MNERLQANAAVLERELGAALRFSPHVHVLSAAQVGLHADGRETYGHSLAIDPWGELLLDMGGDRPGLGFAEVAPERIGAVRAQVPSLANRRAIPTSAA